MKELLGRSQAEETGADLPRGWAWTTLGEIRIDRSQPITPGNMPSQMFELYSVPSFDKQHPEIVSGEEIGSNKQVVSEGMVLLCKINPRINRIWVVGDFSPWPKIASTEWIPFAKREEVDPKYLCSFMQRNDLRDYVAQNASGVGGSLMRVKPGTLVSYPFPLAPLAEQHRIVAKIEELFTNLDAGVDGLKRVKAQLKRYRQSVLKKACEGKLVPTEVELAKADGRSYEGADVILERILRKRRELWERERLEKAESEGRPLSGYGWKQDYEEPVAPDLTSPPSIPEGWVIASIDSLTSRITSGPRDWSKHYGRGRGTFIMAQNVRLRSLDLSFRQPIDPPINDPSRSRSQVSVGDLLVTIVGANTGYVCRVREALPEHYICQSVALMRPVDEVTAPFIVIYLTSQENGQSQYRRYIYGAGRPHLSFEQLKMTPVLLPPLAEQNRILVEVERLLSLADQVEAAIDHSLKQAERLRQSILKRAFEGKLVAQDSNDEPADRLLERIRAPKEQEEIVEKTKRWGSRKLPASQLRLV